MTMTRTVKAESGSEDHFQWLKPFYQLPELYGIISYEYIRTTDTINRVV